MIISVTKSAIKKLSTVMVLLVALTTTWQVSAEDISQRHLQQLMNSEKNFILLDVRTVAEFEQGHIPNAVNIPHKELEARLAELSGKNNTQIVLYCRSGRRVELATEVLNKNGFNQLDHLSGDFNGWTASDLPIVVGK
jgi:rhodanese-related sulfurtransferase